LAVTIRQLLTHFNLQESFDWQRNWPKKAGDRNLPLDLFQGINELPSLYVSAQSNRLDQYTVGPLDPALGLKSGEKSSDQIGGSEDPEHLKDWE
jgi:hypothetical protein